MIMAKEPPPIPLILPQDVEQLKLAVRFLEDPGLAARLADVVGTPVEKLLALLPAAASKTISVVSEKALKVALDVSVATMKKGAYNASPRAHKLAGAVTGAIGGAAGLSGLAVELPVTTTLMFRSIADVARAEGEDLTDPLVCMSCMEVFALGAPSAVDDAAEGVYFGARIALAKSVSEAASFIAKGIAQNHTAPAIVRLVSKLAARFGIVVSYKAAAQMAPVIGAIGGAAVNTLFIDHYQSIAKGHFIVRRLEREYGPRLIRKVYEEIRCGREPDLSGEIFGNVIDADFEILEDNPLN
ncbi:hypothetical protein BVY04_03165 [bacterium M21]|nr:hypothetical protein BVY04_03165 [bacterium M21]